MTKIKVKLQAEKQLFINSDLANGGYYFKVRSKQRQDNGDLEGIKFDRIACLMLMAFAVEARYNFLGSRLVRNWDERSSIDDKIRTVADSLGSRPDLGRRPYQTLIEIKNFRDTIAHGKPAVVTTEIQTMTTVQDIEKLGEIRHPWEKYLNDAYLDRAFQDTEEVWNDLLKLAKIDRLDTLSTATMHLELLQS